MPAHTKSQVYSTWCRHIKPGTVQLENFFGLDVVELLIALWKAVLAVEPEYLHVSYRESLTKTVISTTLFLQNIGQYRYCFVAVSADPVVLVVLIVLEYIVFSTGVHTAVHDTVRHVYDHVYDLIIQLYTSTKFSTRYVTQLYSD
jgi:hypothetical protein